MAAQGHENGFAGAMMVRPVEGPALAKGGPERAFEPNSVAQAVELSKLLVASRLLPKSVQSAEAAFAIIATGRELGLTAMQSLRTIHIIDGKPTLSADLIAALVKSRRDICKWFRLVESTDRVATYETQREGEPHPTRLSFTIEEAQRAGVTSKDNWKRYPAAMLRARCITALARAVYPDLAMGVYESDELEPMPSAAPPVRSPAPAQVVAAVTPDPALVDALLARIAQADRKALAAIASDTKRAMSAGRIDKDGFDRIKLAADLRRSALEHHEIPPPPPPSDDDVAADADASKEPA